jgi:phage-related protein
MSARKPLLWVCSSKKDLKQMPIEIQDVFGYALDLAQLASSIQMQNP